ncbi:MAG: hypothetical protein M1839_001937 [Geoglossum umbratile]|nr:MAG: hypothetical protein M1839_001937 [Geoglossum umbratile]
MDTLLSWGVRILDLVSPARKRRRESTAQPEQPQRPQREASAPTTRQKHPLTTTERVYRIRKHYRARPRLSKKVRARAIIATTTTSEELEDGRKRLPDRSDTSTEYQHKRRGAKPDSEDEEGDSANDQAPYDEAADIEDTDGGQYRIQGDSDEYEEEEEEGEEEGKDFLEDSYLEDTLVDEEQGRKSAERDLMYQKIIEDVNPEGWSEDELALYCRLRMRGREPMLPRHWRGDFDTIPGRLFGNEGVMINSYCQNTFRATQALHALFKLGGRVRDRELAGLPVEGLIKKEVERYMRWSQEDGEFSRKPHIPVLAIAAGSSNQTEEDLEDRIKGKLETLAARYREAFSIATTDVSTPPPHPSSPQYIRPLPTLYGLVISGIVMGFVTYNSADDKAIVRSVGLFDYSTHANDVWNGIAIAYLVISARNYLTGILEHVEEESVDTSDPDA